MLRTFVIQVTDKTFIDEILKEFQWIDLAQCGNCGSVKINAKELAKVLANVDIESECYDYSSEILSEITEGVPDECLADVERWQKWDEDNEYRRLDFLKGYDTDCYLKFEEVLIITDPHCQCFRKEKWSEISINVV
jgi:hypothetical protein